MKQAQHNIGVQCKQSAVLGVAACLEQWDRAQNRNRSHLSIPLPSCRHIASGAVKSAADLYYLNAVARKAKFVIFSVQMASQLSINGQIERGQDVRTQNGTVAFWAAHALFNLRFRNNRFFSWCLPGSCRVMLRKRRCCVFVL